MLFALAKNDFKARYTGSVLGEIWAFVGPLVTMLIYWFVFQVAFRNGGKYDTPYVLWLVSGTVPWLFIQEAWSGATTVLSDYAFLVKKVAFRVEILPLMRVVVALFGHLFFVFLLFVVNFCCGKNPDLWDIQVFYYMFSAIMLTFALGRITAYLAVFLKDVTYVVGVIVQFGFWLTPVFWDIREFGNQIGCFILKLNPFFYVTEGYRESIVQNVGFWEHPLLTGYFWAVVLVLVISGNVIEKKLRPHLADLL